MRAKVYGLTILFLITFSRIKIGAQSLPDFMAGTWKMEDSDHYEQWTRLNDRQMKGISYKLTDGKMQVTEYLEIQKNGDHLFYTATIPGQNQGETIIFRAVTTDSIYTFENPGHDFPKYISYQSPGKNKLIARIGDREKTLEFNFSTAKITSPQTSPDAAINKASFILSGEFWTRPEFRDGYTKLPPSDSKELLFVPNRTRLIFMHHSGKLSSKVVVQDARVFGQTKLINNTDNAATQIFEAWIKYDFTPAFSFKTGRQMLNYGDKRLINDRNWNVNGASYDIMMLQFTQNQGKTDFFEGHLAFGSGANAYSQVFAEEYKVNNHKYFSFLWLSKKFSENIQLNFMDVLTGNQEAGTKHTIHWLNTMGINPILKTGSFSFEGSAYYQHGKTIQGKTAEAYLLAAKVYYTGKKIRLDLGSDLYSGQAVDDLTDKVRTFNPLNYGAHGHLGEMDHFVTIPVAGIQDHFFKVNWFANKYLSAKADFHWFYFTHTQANPVDPEQILARFAGNELDMNIGYKLSKEVQFTLGYSFFLPTADYERYSRIEPGESRFAQWAYLSMIFKPALFEYKAK